MTASETPASRRALGTILALVYSDSALADAVLREVAVRMSDAGLRLAGLVQHNPQRLARSRCDMMLEDLSTGDLVEISEDRGPHARGCILKVDQLLRAIETVRTSLAQQPDLVILNKFGKTESEGRGLRELIAEVVETGLPLLIAVPYRNLENWRAFAGEFSREVVLGTREDSIEAFSCQLTTMVPVRRQRSAGRDQPSANSSGEEPAP